MMEKSSRPQRNRRHSRRAWPPEDDLHQPRPAKRLFTPEIKRMLKDWLVRRRENPYPSRDEKKRLAIDSGLTYTQICNWFANWRRKLKNSKNERAKKSWGHLIKNYNTNAKGNVEQFSISSEDSIWEEEERFGALEMMRRPSGDDDDYSSGTDTVNKSIESSERRYYAETCQPNYETVKMEHSNYYYAAEGGVHTTAQCYQISSTTTDEQNELPKHGTNSNTNSTAKTFSTTKAKYKQKMMEKYMRDMHVEAQSTAHKIPLSPPGAGATELSKWLESAAKFTPDKNNYFIEWNNRRNKLDKTQRVKQPRRPTMPHNSSAADLHVYDTIHHQDELEAAEALANFAFNCRQRLLNAISS